MDSPKKLDQLVMVHDTNGDDGVETTPISRRTTYLYMGTSIGSDMSESLGFWIMMGMVNIMRDVKKQLFYHDDRCAYVLITIAKQCKLYDIGMDVFFPCWTRTEFLGMLVILAKCHPTVLG